MAQKAKKQRYWAGMTKIGLRVNDTDLAFCGRPGPKNNASKSRLSILPANDVITLDHRGYPHSRASVFHAFLHADDLS